MTGEATVRLQALGGTWETVGVDRARGVYVEGLQMVSNEWGFDTARFTLRRDPGAVFPDLTAFTPVEVEVNGEIDWEGFVWETPTIEGSDFQIGVECRGWQYHLDDDLYQRAYVHSKLTEWKDPRGFLTTDLSMWRSSASVEVGERAITFGWAKGAAIVTNDRAGVTLDLGPDSTAKRVVFNLEAIGGANVVNTAFTLLIRGHDAENPEAAGVYEDSTPLAMETFTDGYRAKTFTTARRFVTIFLYSDSYTGAAGNDGQLRVVSAQVFRLTAYESSNASILLASDVIADALTFAPLLDQSTDEIATSDFPIPDFWLSEDRTPREVFEAANALHRWVLKVKAGRKVRFAERPTVPLLRVGDWAGAEFKDASRNSGEEIYNRALATGTGPDGAPLKVGRYAADLTGAVVQAKNPGFETNTANWTVSNGTLTRDTGILHSGVASGKLTTSVAGNSIVTLSASAGSLDGSFEAGKTYILEFWYRLRVAPVAPGPPRFYLAGMDAATQATYTLSSTVGVWTKLRCAFRVALPASVVFTFDFPNASSTDVANVDDVFIYGPDGTLPGRRNFLRTKALQIAPALNEAIAQQFADVYLQGHGRSPLKGSLTAHGTAVRTYLGDAPVHPAHLLLHTTELIHLSHVVDPDTGHVGRDAPIATVSYDHDQQRSEIALDDTRENVERMIARYSTVVG